MKFNHLGILLFTVIALYITEFKEEYMKIIGGLIFLAVLMYAGYKDSTKEETEEVEVQDESKY